MRKPSKTDAMYDKDGYLKPEYALQVTTWAFCYKCGKKLILYNNLDVKTGHCAKCRNEENEWLDSGKDFRLFIAIGKIKDHSSSKTRFSKPRSKIAKLYDEKGYLKSQYAIQKTTWAFCGKCGRDLSLYRTNDITSGFCSKCRDNEKMKFDGDRISQYQIILAIGKEG